MINKEEDIAAYTIKTVDDPRTLNKILYINPPKNTLSMNEMVSLWETKISKSLEKTHIPEEQVLKLIQGLVSFLDFFLIRHFLFTKLKRCAILCVCVCAESPVPINVLLAINHSVFVKGDQTNFTIEPSFGLEASQIYPDVKYTSIEEYLSHFA